MAVLRRGSRGAQVGDLQRRLAALGFNPGPTDGIYGPRTAAAVRAYQASVGLATDGIAGNLTLGRLAQGGAPQNAPAPQVQATPQAPPGQPAPVDNPNQLQASPRALNPEEDPQFLAFQRALGTQENELRASIAMQRARLQSDLANRMPEFDRQKAEGLENIQNDYLNRGTFRSGMRLQEQDRTAGGVERQRASAIQQTRQGTADLEGSLARQIAENRRRLAEEGINTRQRLSIDAAKVGAR